MKRLIFILVLMPLFSNAQLEIGANAGGSYLITSGYSNDGSLRSDFNFSASWKLLKYFKAGIGYDMPTLSAGYYYYGKPAGIANIFADAVKGFGRSSVYAGLSVGSYSSKWTFQDTYGAITNYKYKGPCYGAQIGYSVRVIKGLFLNAEIAYRRANLTEQLDNVGNPLVVLKGHLSYATAGVGVHYRFHFGK
jgi:hypothetical protein